MDGTASRITSMAFIDARSHLRQHNIEVTKDRIMSAMKLWAIKYASKEQLIPDMENVEDEDEFLLRQMIDFGVLARLIEDAGERIYLEICKSLPTASTHDCELLFWGLFRNYFNAANLHMEDTKFKNSRADLKALEVGQSRLALIKEDRVEKAAADGSKKF